MQRFMLLGLAMIAVGATILASAVSPDCEFESTDDAACAPPALDVIRITPSGADVPASRQIVIEFDRPVVPLGRMERDADEIPIRITPHLDCRWRWLNPKTLACQLGVKTAMVPATRYTVELGTAITALDGGSLSEPRRHEFVTARPAVSYTRFVDWLAPGTPLIEMSFNQAVTAQSVEKSVTMVTASTRYPIDAFADVASTQTLDPSDDTGDSQPARLTWLVRPRSELPLDTTVSLNIDRGFASAAGAEPSTGDQLILSFDTHPQFALVGIRCTVKGRKEAQVIALDKLSQNLTATEMKERCVPLQPIALLFSTPVLISELKRHLNIHPALGDARDPQDPWRGYDDYSQLHSPHRRDRYYQSLLPKPLRAFQQYEIRIAADSLVDEFGRSLQHPVHFSILTSHREPDLKLQYADAVLEQGVATDVPLYVTNLNRIDIRYDRRSPKHLDRNLAMQLSVPDFIDNAFALPLTLRRLLDDKSGAIYARLSPQPQPPNWRGDRELLAQITPFQVHYKLGHFNSLAWVSALADDSLIAGAEVALLVGRRDALTELRPLGISAQTDALGRAELPGLAAIDPELELVYGHDGDTLFLTATKDGHSALLPIDYSYTARSAGTYSWLRRRGGHAHAWGVSAQGIYKLGDTIDYKIFLREQSNRHWIAPQDRDYVLRVVDPKGNTIFEDRRVRLSAFGATAGKLAVPAQGVSGWYRFQLQPATTDPEEHARFTWSPLSVLVTDFTPAPFKVSTELNGDEFAVGDNIEVTAMASLHAGGPFTNAAARVHARLQPRRFVADNPNWREFTFAAVTARGASNDIVKVHESRGATDNKGQHISSFRLPDQEIYHGKLTVESALSDDRGKSHSAVATATYFGRDRFVGLRNTRWLYQLGEPAVVETVVLDRHGRAVAGAEIAIAIQRRDIKSARVKGPGNAFLTKNIITWVETSRCELISTDTALNCEFIPTAPGDYRVFARIKDSQGREHESHINAWVSGRGNVVWDQGNDTNLQLVAEKSEFTVGETARYLLKNPFPDARALISVERYGILDSWVQRLASSTPVIEVPIKANYAPGVYVSVVVVSPRVAEALSPQKLDLGKPSFRMGYARAIVREPQRELAINVTADGETYKPGATVELKIEVEQTAENDPEPVEITVAVVDEAVLAMNKSGAKYYDPNAGFDRLEQLDINNYSLLKRLVGRQKLEKKGANPGGGGGGAHAEFRSAIKHVAHWQANLRPDPTGAATLSFALPDTLTAWRIFALAVSPNASMGLGRTRIKVNRATEIRPAMPNQVAAGDTYDAGFTITNRTARHRELEVNLSLSGALAAATPAQTQTTIAIAPYARETISVPVATSGAGLVISKITAGDPTDTDAFEHRLQVAARTPLTTAASYGSLTNKLATIVLEPPDDRVPGSGAIDITLAASVLGGLDGAISYLQKYPYACWEQRLSKAAVAASYLDLKPYLATTTSWSDASVVIASTLTSAVNFQAPNGGMAYWISGNRYVSPYLSAYTARAFQWLQGAGFAIPAQVEARLHDYLLSLLRHDVFPRFYDKGMASSVRAVALAALAESNKVTPADIARYLEHLPRMNLFGKTQFLQAAIDTLGTDANTVSAAVDDILAHADQSGGKYRLTESWVDNYKHMLGSPTRTNCAALSSLLRAGASTKLAASLKHIPQKLVRTITHSRGRRDHWENTQENVFCLNALSDYAQAFENTEPKLAATISMDKKLVGTADFRGKSAPKKNFSLDLALAPKNRATNVTIEKTGKGRLYYATQMRYRLPQAVLRRSNAGFEVRREYAVKRQERFVLLHDQMQLRRGDVVRIDLFVSIPSARHFVVVDDPIPGGLEPVNTDLATTSVIDARSPNDLIADGSWFHEIADWIRYSEHFGAFYHKELRHDAARFYADYLPAGNYHLSYTAQAIATGTFQAPRARAEEMYDPDVYGTSAPMTLRVAD